MAQRIATWLISDNGKKFSFGIACMTTIGIYSAYTLPNTWFLDKYKDFAHLYNSGLAVPVPEVIKKRFNTTLDLLKIPDTDKSRIRTFTICGFDILNAGTLHSKFGGLIGIPINYSYNDLDDIDKKKILLNNEPINWNSPEAQQLLNSFVLSEKAQLFSIAREVLILRTYKLFLDTFYGTTIFIAMYCCANHLNRKFNLYIRPTRLRIALYSLIGCFGFGIYAFFTDYTQNYYDQYIDRTLSEENALFVEGGKEFYEKMIQRNIALRKLMGSYGERKYSALGNENHLIRNKSIPVVVRRDFFINKLEHSV